MILSPPTKLQALRERIRVRAALRGKHVCTACDTPGEHTDAQCIARRPLCQIPECRKRTCMQARCGGFGALCLDCFFSRAYEHERLLPEVGIFVQPARGHSGVVGIVASIGQAWGGIAVEVRTDIATSTMTSPLTFWDRWERSEEIPAFLRRRAA